METLAGEMSRLGRYDHEALDMVLRTIVPAQHASHRGVWQEVKRDSFNLLFGMYAHGPMKGTTKATTQYPHLCQYVNACVAKWFPNMIPEWTSVCITNNMKSNMHMDVNNLVESDNFTCSYGNFEKGGIWLELREEDPDPGEPLTWKNKPNGTRVPGVALSTRHRPLQFSPRRYHVTLPWSGQRIVVTAFTAKGAVSMSEDERKLLSKSGFIIPKDCGRGTEILVASGEDEPEREEEFVLTTQEQEEVLKPFHNALDALEEIQIAYPPESRMDVMLLCDPWIHPDRVAHGLEEAGLSHGTLGFRERCDLGTHRGFLEAAERLRALSPRWVVCNVPRGPDESLNASQLVDKDAARVRKYLKVVRHLLLLSRQAVEQKSEVIWVTKPSSQVWRLSEVCAFWKVKGSGPMAIGDEIVKVTSTNLAIQNTFSTSVSAEKSNFWTWIARFVKPNHEELMWNEDGEIMPIDTSPLEELEPAELQRLEESVLKLHRRFGHPNNRLLVKNLQARGANPLVIAAASQIQCDECLEGKVRMPSPVVNLERTDRLWSCLQIDGWDLKFDGRMHHFVLMVDEASGYAVIREAYSVPEEEGRNITGQEVMDILQEAWFQYFGYPEVIKLDLEGAHRSSKLRELCLGKGIDLVAAPAEHHEMIAQVERTIGLLRAKTEAFLRGSPEHPRRAALAMVAAHNSLARIHGFSPMQWALGRDWSPGGRLQDSELDEISVSESSSWQVRKEAEQAFLEHRAREHATRAKNARVREQARYLPGDLVFYRRYQHPADLPANSMVDYPRMRTARWFGPARVLATETKSDGTSRRPSAMVWAIAAGRLKKFHASQLRHASTSEKLISGAVSSVSFPWTMTALSNLMHKGSYDDETRAKKRTWGRSSKAKQKDREIREHHPEVHKRGAISEVPEHVRDAPSDEEMVPDRPTGSKRVLLPEESGVAPVDMERMLEDVTYLPQGIPGPVSFQEQRSMHERGELPWHVRNSSSAMFMEESEFETTLFSVVLDIPEDPKAWRRILKDPSKFMVKNVQKGVEVALHKLDPDQRKAMESAKVAELESWLGHKVAKAACPSIQEHQAMKMRWIYTFKSAGEGEENRGKVKAKARIVVLGYSDPSLLERTTSSPAMSRLSKMLLLNMASARRWKVLAGDVRTAFLQAKPRDRLHPLYAKPLPELSKAMGLSEGQMIELLGSAYGLTSAPREWFEDLASTLRKLGAKQSKVDPCLWRVLNAEAQVVGILGIHVDDVLFTGDEASSTWTTFLHEFHASYQWALWEAENFLHCGLRLQQMSDDSVILDHSDFCANLSQMPSRAKGDEKDLSEQELSQARAILGSAQWRVTQSGPQHAAKLSFLQSFLATRHFSAVEQINKLVREIYSARHISVRVQQLGEQQPEKMMMIGWSDAALANRPDGTSTGGHIFGFMHPKDFEKGFGKVNPLGWKSSKLNRVARSSLSAEVQSLADLEQEMMLARLTWCELLGHDIDLQQPQSFVKKIPAAMVIDAKAVYDVLERDGVMSATVGIKDKYSALELAALQQHIREQKTTVLWCDSDRQLADGLTKSAKQDAIKNFLATGVWKIRMDGAFISAKKRRSMNSSVAPQAQDQEDP